VSGPKTPSGTSATAASAASWVHDPQAVRHRHAAHFQRDWAWRAKALVIGTGMLALLSYAVASFETSWRRVFGGIGRLGEFVVLMWPPLPHTTASAVMYAQALAESLAIAFLGTLLAALLAFPFAFLAAKNVIPNPFVHFAARRTLDGIRAIDTLIWALIWVSAVGLGPFAGILAIACADFGIFGKLFSEAIEASERGPQEGVRAAGGSKSEAVRWGLLPQVLPVIASQVLYFFESNTRGATIIGIVGAGGIGLHLSELIRTLEWGSVAFVVGMILVAVGLIDFVSSRLRFAMIGRQTNAGL
jgi:phosphonate transport system permease protein